MTDLIAVAKQFTRQGAVVDVREFGNGNINTTFLVSTNAAEQPCFILQRINTQIFHRPKLVMGNMRVATEHILGRLERASLEEGRRWEVPLVLLAQDGRDYWVDPNGMFWRAMSFIDGRSFDTIHDSAHASEIGFALGLFHLLLSDLPAERLADTLEGFHITPLYLEHYRAVLAHRTAENTPEVTYCLQFVNRRHALVHVLEHAKAEGTVRLRPIHGDPKVNNILIDPTAGQAIGIVDLDTVKPGLIHYDIGDCIRSGCNPLGEETEQWERVQFDTDMCRTILESYLTIARSFLTGHDIDYIYESVRLMAFELGLRFFTDHLEGNVYFKARHRDHNLTRALVQFRLTESIEKQETALRALIRDMG